jgi:hypothetical protein
MRVPRMASERAQAARRPQIENGLEHVTIPRLNKCRLILLRDRLDFLLDSGLGRRTSRVELGNVRGNLGLVVGEGQPALGI